MIHQLRAIDPAIVQQLKGTTADSITKASVHAQARAEAAMGVPGVVDENGVVDVRKAHDALGLLFSGPGQTDDFHVTINGIAHEAFGTTDLSQEHVVARIANTEAALVAITGKDRELSEEEIVDNAKVFNSRLSGWMAFAASIDEGS